MNRIAVLLALTFNSIIILAFNSDTTSSTLPKDSVKYWKFENLSLVSIAQNTFVNWSVGGESSLTGKAATDYNLTYRKKKFGFDHSANLVFGLVGYIDKRVEKTNDILLNDFFLNLIHY